MMNSAAPEVAVVGTPKSGVGCAVGGGPPKGEVGCTVGSGPPKGDHVAGALVLTGGARIDGISETSTVAGSSGQRLTGGKDGRISWTSTVSGSIGQRLTGGGEG